MLSYLWAINLVFVSLCSFFAAKSASSVIADAVEPSIEPAAASRPQTLTTAKNEPRPLEIISERNLLDAKKEILEPKEEVKEDKAAIEAKAQLADGELPPDESMHECSLGGELVATIAANDPAWSMVIYSPGKKGEPKVFGIGGDAAKIDDGYTVMDIRQKAIVVLNSDSEYELCELGKEYSKKPKTPKPAATTTAAAEPASEEIGTSVQKVDEFNYVVEKGEVDKVMNNLSQVASQARLVPNFKNGKSNGFKIFSIRPGSIFSKLGLKNGDIIQKVNGYEMNSPDKALELYQKLKETSNLGVEITRHGKVENINVSIR